MVSDIASYLFNKYCGIVFLIVGLSNNCKAQITLEHTFNSTFFGRDFYITDIGNNNSKYVFIDTTANSFSLYNLDGTPFLLNIFTPEPIMPSYNIAYITNTLFDCDSTTIEYAFMSYLDATKPFRVIRTDGTVLLKVDSARGPVCYGCIAGTKEIVPIVNTQEGAKLFLFKINSNLVRETLVYGLCGKLPETTIPLELGSSNVFVKVFPNPTSNNIQFQITCPNNLEEFNLVIYDSQSKRINSSPINGVFNSLNINCEYFADGTYFYSLQNKNRVFQSGKFVISK